EIKRHGLVSLVAARAAVFVPVLDDLPVFYEGGEALAETVNAFADAERELFKKKVPALRPLRVAERTPAASREHPAAGLECQIPVAALQRNTRGEIARAQRGFLFADGNRGLRRGRRLQRDARPALQPARIMFDARFDDAGHDRAQSQREQRALQCLTAMPHDLRRGEDKQVVTVAPCFVGFGGVMRGDVGLMEPEAVGEFHVEWGEIIFDLKSATLAPDLVCGTFEMAAN